MFIAFVVFFFLMAVGQWISDYYIDYRYYDLQNNWHYLAYFLFAFVISSYLKQKNIAHKKSNYLIFSIAAGISLFDESFQNLLSERIFDLSDVAKDLWGVTLGIGFIHFFSSGKTKKDKSFWLLLVLSFIYLNVSALLTNAGYAFYVLFITLLLFIPFALIIIYWELRVSKYVRYLIVVLCLVQGVIWGVSRNTNILFHNNFFTVYNGVPLPFFDVVIYPDHTFRLVDKKVFFSKTDKETLLKNKPDIILVGAGKSMEGGNGFPYKDKSHFIYNKFTNQAVQVIILDSGAACEKYNELTDKGLKTLFVLHKIL